MSNQRRLDEHAQTSYTTTPENDKKIRKIKSASAMWPTSLTTASAVLVFCVNFVYENIDAVNEAMEDQANNGTK